MVKKSFLLATYCFYYSAAWAVDFGISGHVYRIVEQPFLEMVRERLAKVDIKQEQEKMQAAVREYVENPKPASGVMEAIESKEYYWDPTYIVKKDIILPCGKILYKAGTKINPLEYMKFDRRLLLIDGRQEIQVNWLVNSLINEMKNDTQNLIKNRVILVAGKPFELQDKLRNAQLDYQVYFDQLGEIVSKLGINAVPAIAEQDGLKIKINEIGME